MSLQLSESSVDRQQLDGHVENEGGSGIGMNSSQAVNLFISHSLSTWIARTYEFSAIIFTASAYPQTLAASSIRGLATTFASIFLSPAIGRWIDRAPNRLTSLLTTICINRANVIGACLIWMFLVPGREETAQALLESTIDSSEDFKNLLFFAVVVLGIVEKLSGSANMIVMERDWVVTVASPEGQSYDLTSLNSVMRRIDLFCKLCAPIFISVVISLVKSPRVGAILVLGMSIFSWGFEYSSAKRVYSQNSKLRGNKITPKLVLNTQQSPETAADAGRELTRPTLCSRVYSVSQRLTQELKDYFSSRAYVPSLALSLLHVSVLSYSATLITYLLSVGFSLDLITIARAVGSVVEISSTVLTPFGVTYFGRGQVRSYRDYHLINDSEVEAPREQHGEQTGNVEVGLERLGLWGLNWQLLNLIPVVTVLWVLSSEDSVAYMNLISRIIDPTGPFGRKTCLAVILFTFLSMSRLGLWIFDLTTQQLSQTLVVETQRSSFAGVESSFVNLFEFTQYIAAIIWHKPEQFKYLAMASLIAVAVSAFAYAGWVWRQRGHLLHWEKVKKCECIDRRGS